MREKLIELIGKVQDEGLDYSDVVCVYKTSNGRLADYLIANGVTIPVRCKDCAVPHNRFTGCPNLNGLIPPQDFYCAYGERRTDA